MQISLWGKNIRSFYCFDYAIFLTCFPIYGDREIREGDSLLEAARARQGRCLRGVGKYLPASNPSHPDMPRYVPVVYTCVCVCVRVCSCPWEWKPHTDHARQTSESLDSENRFLRVSEQVISLRALVPLPLFLSLSSTFIRIEKKRERERERREKGKARQQRPRAVLVAKSFDERPNNRIDATWRSAMSRRRFSSPAD